MGCGAAPERYRRYAADVRAEYAHVDDDAWRAGRSAVFVTDRAHDALDAAARRNLAAELAALQRGQPQA